MNFTEYPRVRVPVNNEERAALHDSIREGIEDMEAGRTVDAKKAIAELRSRP